MGTVSPPSLPGEKGRGWDGGRGGNARCFQLGIRFLGFVDSLFLEEAEPDSSRFERPALCGRGPAWRQKPPLPHAPCFTLPMEQKAPSVFIKVFKQGFGGAGL